MPNLYEGETEHGIKYLKAKNSITLTTITRRYTLTMAVSALDSRIFRNLIGTQEIRDIFTYEAYVRSLIEVEAALPRAEATVGVIPADAGKAITDAFASLQIEYVQFVSCNHRIDTHRFFVATSVW
jgi:hypothetical protein